MGVRRFFISCSLFSLLSSLHAQIVIKEEVVISPKQRPMVEVSSISSAPLLRLNGNLVQTTTPGVVISGALDVSPGDIPENTAYEVWVNVGGSSHLVKRVGTGYCIASVNESNPFPHTLEGCGVIAMSATTFVPAPWQWSCSPREAGIDLPIINGNTATITAYGTLWYTGFTATLTITASLDESYLPARIVVTPRRDTLACTDFSVIDVAVLDGRGNLFTGCNGIQLDGRASIKAKGPYAFLEWTGQMGSSVDFELMNGRGTFLAVLDTSKGFIEGGHDVTELQVEVEGKIGTAPVVMFCSLPPPSVAITFPGADTSITLARDNLPTIVFGEAHSPGPGEPFEPSISWNPGPALATAAYFEAMNDSLVIPVKVTAENVAGRATDERHITLRKSCDLAPPLYRQGDSPWATQTYDSTEVGIKTLGCALSCMAMAMTAFGDTVNPGGLNDWMKKKEYDQGGFWHERVNWEAVKMHNNLAINFPPANADTGFALTLLDPFLEQCQLIVVKVFNPKTVEHKSQAEREEARKKGNHWVLVVKKNSSDYAILDPGRGLTTLSQYGRIFRYVQIAKR